MIATVGRERPRIRYELAVVGWERAHVERRVLRRRWTLRASLTLDRLIVREERLHSELHDRRVA